MKFDPRFSRLPSSTYRRISDLQSLLVLSTVHYIRGVERLDPSFKLSFSYQMPSLNQSMVDGILLRITNLAETFAGSNAAPLLGLQDETPGEAQNCLRFPTSLPNNQLLICSSVAVNFVAIIESVHELELLLAGISHGSRTSLHSSVRDVAV
ncbi:hypothetical protein CPB84DRAFT_271485 [Gymnopilus junonius]|uniref:Uncharacterized protein n=1 Tax=Gymnopilus junonius TaxID=109634 RepID=A0A9P5NWH2_GYMJU|nr:hypothetical protein CPB84DRAFT_271485 [Gymnopilus junonius]